MAARVFSICFICTGNRFRSPLAQAFVERLTLGLPAQIQISTAGTLESQGAPALPEARQIAVLCGVDLSGHRSQRLSALSLEATDLVIGHPLNMDDSVGPKAKEAEAIAEKLRVELGLSVHLIDERLTSYEAESTIAKSRRRDVRASGIIDSRAATLILQDYLNQILPPPESELP